MGSRSGAEAIDRAFEAVVRRVEADAEWEYGAEPQEMPPRKGRVHHLAVIHRACDIRRRTPALATTNLVLREFRVLVESRADYGARSLPSRSLDAHHEPAGPQPQRYDHRGALAILRMRPA